MLCSIISSMVWYHSLSMNKPQGSRLFYWDTWYWYWYVRCSRLPFLAQIFCLLIFGVVISLTKVNVVIIFIVNVLNNEQHQQP